MASITPIDYDPFAPPALPVGVTVTPVDHDPFAGQTIGPSAPLPTNVSDDQTQSAGIGTQAASSLPTDEMARVKYLATKRFPNLSQNDAVDRYFYKDNRLAYKNDDGTANFEDPALALPTSVSKAVGDVKDLATVIGPSLAPIGSTVGALPPFLKALPAGSQVPPRQRLERLEVISYDRLWRPI